ncbi:hypothetical protein F2Q69_00036030 [Brassica cretica]|uniref:Uncharacterized protein n=1 Tax=Brassica cretica TaxID=69181 RepID=A0A8S9SVS5_BRACR|nr:hypothetical protein F2Q69_00036030 [Brassica cretica]
MLEELNVKFSLMDAIQMIPSMHSLVKGLISGKASADSDIMMVSKECSALLQNRTNAALTPQQGMIEEILAYDPLELALIRVESEQNTCNVDVDRYEKMLDSSEIIEKPVAFLSLGETSNQISPEGNNPQAALVTASGPPDELKGMMQQLLQGQQIQGKALNQVTTEINTRMDNMFTELNSKYDVVASHIRQMDVQIAQTAETIKRQQGTFPGKTDKNPKDCNAVELRSGRHLSDPVPKKLTAQEKGKQKEGEQPLLEDVHDDDHEPEHPTAAEPVAPTTQEQPVPTRVYIPKVPYPVPAKKSRKDCEEMKCKKMLEELNVKISLMDAIQMIPSMRRMIEEILSDDPLEVALIRVESE